MGDRPIARTLGTTGRRNADTSVLYETRDLIAGFLFVQISV